MYREGGAGADTLTGDGNWDTLLGMAGNDQIRGLGGEDVIFGGAGHDSIYGGDGDDYLVGGQGNDLVDGGAGIDAAGYEDAPSAVKVDLTLTAAQYTLGGGTDRLVSIENLSGSAFADTLIGSAVGNGLNGEAGNDSITGAAGEDWLAGDVGDDTLIGGADDDYLMGGPGNDLLDGGAGIDGVGYETATTGVRVDLSLTTAQNTLGGGTDRLVSIENLNGSDFGDTLIGDAGSNGVNGQAGNDSIFGGGGDDWLEGGAGTDTLSGGDGSDTVSYLNTDLKGNTVGVTIHLGDGTAFNEDGKFETLISIENAYGTSGRDFMSGSSAANYLNGGEGGDYFLGVWTTGDVLDGDVGNDTISITDFTTLVAEGGEGYDALNILNAGSAPGGFRLDMAISGPQQVSANQVLTISGFEEVSGSSYYGETFYASTSFTRFICEGQDTVVYRSLAEIGLGATSDIIRTGVGNTTIDISSIDADVTKAGVQDFVWLNGGATFTGHAGEIQQTFIGEGMRIDFDVNGDKVADASLFVELVSGGSSAFVF